jgi:cell wall-associated NlpC family hydrolase
VASHDERTHPGPDPLRRPRRTLVAAALTGALLVGLPLSSAQADPTPPSNQDVQAAQQAVTSAAGDVATMEVRLAQLSAVADDAQVAVERAGEAYAQALSDAQAAQTTADEAAARSHQADADSETARQALMAYAREMARSGGSVDAISAVLSANGFQDVAQRTADLSMLTGKADATVQAFRAAQLVAGTLRSRATDAAHVATSKQADAQTALTAAQKVQTDTQTQVAAASAERDTLIAALAQAQQVSAAVEKARQDAIDQQRRQREEDAAKAARLASATITTTSAGATTGTPAGAGVAPGTGGGTTTGTAGTTSGAPATGGTTTGGASSSTTTTGGTTAGAPTTGTPTPSATTAGGTTTGTGTTTGSSGSSGAYGLGTGRSRGTAAEGEAALAFATAQLGKPYVWGGSGPNGYDCSGLTMTSWLNAGVAINRTAADQYKQVLKIAYDQLRPGDLVFWTDDPSDPNLVYHVAMWAGNGQIVEASRPGVPRRITSMRWSGTMPYAGRP